MSPHLSQEGKRAIRIAVCAFAGVLGLALVFGAIWVATRPRVRIPVAAETTHTAPAETTSTATPTASIEPSAAPATTPSQTPSPGVSGSRPGTVKSSPGAPVRAALVAFRLDGAVCVAGEDGSAVRQVLASADGPFSLSPDGRTLALVDSEMLKLIDVATGKTDQVGAAEPDVPVWAPDSSVALFVRAGDGHVGTDVWRVARTGGGARKLVAGSEPGFSANGKVVVAVGQDGAVVVSRDGHAFKSVRVPGSPTGVATDGSRLLVALADAEGAAASIVRCGLDGSAVTQVAGPPSSADARMASYGSLMLSPDGSWLVFAAESDDGYSRMFSVKASGGQVESLSYRRDDYPHGFDAAGDSVYFVEGNAFQGDATALWRVDCDGGDRSLVVSGAR